MGYELLEQNLAVFDELLSRLKLKIEDDTAVKPDFETVREELADRRSQQESVWLPKWKPRFKEFYHAQIVVHRLVDATVSLKDQTPHLLRARLKQVLSGPLTQDFEPSASKDYFYELELAALWKDNGFTVELREPDIVVSGKNLTKPVGVACKYPSSWEQIHDHVSKGYRQITKHGYEGLVAIGLDQLVFQGMKNYMDFRQGDRHPLDVMQSAVNEATQNLVAIRARDYPSEKPIDGAMLTLGAIGMYGEPAKLTKVMATALQCDRDNPRYADFGVLYENLKGLRTEP
jgi:hypothetical protein